MIAALAVLGRSVRVGRSSTLVWPSRAQNGPLYLKCLTGDPLAFQFIVHASLDVIEDKRTPSPPSLLRELIRDSAATWQGRRR